MDQWGRVFPHHIGIEMATTPHVVIFDPAGQVVAADRAGDKQGLELLYDWMGAELERSRERRRTGG